jgi:serine/threonine protein phosphatase PrpC
LICAIADGQGGQPRGGPAARLACQACVDLAAALSPVRLRLADAWAGIVNRVDRTVADDSGTGLTTFIGLCVVGEWLAGASVGDSAAMLACEGKPATTLTRRQFKDPPIGSGMATAIGFSAALVRPWTLLVMTDGVWKYAGWEKVRACAEGGHGADMLETLRAAVRLRSGAYPDDFTVVVVQSD